MRSLLILFISALAFVGCKQEAALTGANFDTTGFESTSLGDGVFLMTKTDPDGLVIEQGIVRDGMKNGMWVTFNEKGVVSQVSSYVNGLETGVRMEFSKNGQMEKKTTYVANQLDGAFGEYKFGKPIKEAEYKGGVRHGAYKEYFKNKGTLQKLVEFKNGKQDGKMQYYDDEGNVTLEYTYKNGEKVEGGLK
jgi:antitoxin component YwqK of YwqJK toxin-antitoxin module